MKLIELHPSSAALGFGLACLTALAMSNTPSLPQAGACSKWQVVPVQQKEGSAYLYNVETAETYVWSLTVGRLSA